MYIAVRLLYASWSWDDRYRAAHNSLAGCLSFESIFAYTFTFSDVRRDIRSKLAWYLSIVY